MKPLWEIVSRNEPETLQVAFDTFKQKKSKANVWLRGVNYLFNQVPITFDQNGMYGVLRSDLEILNRQHKDNIDQDISIDNQSISDYEKAADRWQYFIDQADIVKVKIERFIEENNITPRDTRDGVDAGPAIGQIQNNQIVSTE